MSPLEWILILSAAASLVTLAAGVLFYALGGVFGPLSDIVSVVQMGLMTITAVYIYQLGQATSFILALAAFLIGLAGTLVVGVLQLLLVLQVVSFEASFLPVLAGGVDIGIWLALGSLTVAMGVVVPPGWLVLGMATAVGYVLPIIGYRLGGAKHPLFYIGSLLGVAGYAAWALWLVRIV